MSMGRGEERQMERRPQRGTDLSFLGKPKNWSSRPISLGVNIKLKKAGKGTMGGGGPLRDLRHELHSSAI